MKGCLRLLCFGVFAILGYLGFGQDCCLDCTCYLCGDIAACEQSPIHTPEECNSAGAFNCGTGDDEQPCTTFWENNTEGVQSDIPQPTDPNGCIPIDGGLGFLIAGGLGIGIVGIRRRKEQPLLKRA